MPGVLKIDSNHTRAEKNQVSEDALTCGNTETKLIRRQIMERKRIVGHLGYPAVLAVALALLVFAVFVTPGPSLAAPPEPGMKTGAVSKADNVEARIKDLHAKLAITPAQEELWNNVAQAMRDNGKTMEALIKARSEKAGTMTAVDDLKSYGEIADAHADGIKKFIPVFEPLYASMSDAQKKDADKLFHHQDRAKPKAKGKSK
jgi:protein CpxP